MSKNRFLMIITFFLIGITGAIAQDATNEATWTETIDFINKNSNYLNNTREDGNSKWVFSDISISQNFLLKGNKKYYYEDELTFDDNFEIDLSKLERVFEIREEFEESQGNFRLIFTGDYAVIVNGDKKEDYFLSVVNSEMFPITLNAFKHLAYLITTRK